MYVLNTNITFIDATVAVLGWRLAETSEGQVNSFEVLPPPAATNGAVAPDVPSKHFVDCLHGIHRCSLAGQLSCPAMTSGGLNNEG